MKFHWDDIAYLCELLKLKWLSVLLKMWRNKTWTKLKSSILKQIGCCPILFFCKIKIVMLSTGRHFEIYHGICLKLWQGKWDTIVFFFLNIYYYCTVIPLHTLIQISEHLWFFLSHRVEQNKRRVVEIIELERKQAVLRTRYAMKRV